MWTVGTSDYTESTRGLFHAFMIAAIWALSGENAENIKIYKA